MDETQIEIPIGQAGQAEPMIAPPSTENSAAEQSPVAQTEVQQPVMEQHAERLFYSIGEVSDLTGVEPYVLRYWESEFKILHPSKRSSGQRSYQKKDIETILQIKRLLYDELYTIAGARKKLREGRVTQEGKPEEALEPLVIERVQKDEEATNLLKEIRVELQALQEEIKSL